MAAGGERIVCVIGSADVKRQEFLDWVPTALPEANKVCLFSCIFLPSLCYRRSTWPEKTPPSF